MPEIKDREEKLAVALLLLRAGSLRITRLIEKYHARLYQLGIDAGAVIGGEAQLLTTIIAGEKVGEIVLSEASYVSKWIQEDLGRKLSVAINAEYSSLGEAQDFISSSAYSLRYRGRNFALTGHGTAYHGLREEMIYQADVFENLNVGWRIEALFTAFPESDVIATSCDGCMAAAGGNPYVPGTVPIPGDFECAFNCRHEIWYKKVPMEGIAA